MVSITKRNLTVINDGKEILNFSNVVSLHFKLLPNIININLRFIDGRN